MSNRIEQNGDDDAGILGFLENDIRGGIKIGKRQKCAFCQKFNATIYCRGGCRTKAFHLKCGLDNNCLFQFSDEFKSFCTKHVPNRTEIKYNMACLICKTYITKDMDSTQTVPSCCRRYWFHRDCMKSYALSSGYYLKCIGCDKSSGNYRDTLRERGVYVPDQDAAWERSENPYRELLYRHGSCDAVICKCPQGRKYKQKHSDADWYLKLCKFCGASGVHKNCAQNSSPDYMCGNCITVSRKRNLHQLEVTTYESTFRSLDTDLDARVDKCKEQAKAAIDQNTLLEQTITPDASSTSISDQHNLEETAYNAEKRPTSGKRPSDGKTLEHLLPPAKSPKLSCTIPIWSQTNNRPTPNADGASTSRIDIDNDINHLDYPENRSQMNGAQQSATPCGSGAPSQPTLNQTDEPAGPQNTANNSMVILVCDSDDEHELSVNGIVTEMAAQQNVQMPKPFFAQDLPAHKMSDKGWDNVQDWNEKDSRKLRQIRFELLLNKM